MNRKRVLGTGEPGFIGADLADESLAAGGEVRAPDDLGAGDRRSCVSDASASPREGVERRSSGLGQPDRGRARRVG